MTARVWDRRVVWSELSGAGGGWGNEEGGEWEGAGMRHVNSSPRRQISDPLRRCREGAGYAYGTPLSRSCPASTTPTRSKIIQNSGPLPGLRPKGCLHLRLLGLLLGFLCNQPVLEVSVPEMSLG